MTDVLAQFSPGQDPINFFVTLALIPVMGFAAVWIVQRMVAGDLPALYGVGALFLLVSLFGIAIFVPDQRMAGPIVVALVAVMAFFPFAETQLERHELEAVQTLHLDRAHRELDVRPENASARFHLAEALWERGLGGHAIALAEDTLNALSTERDAFSQRSHRDFFDREERMARRWREQLTDPRANDPVACPMCKHANPPGNLACGNCKGPYLLALARKKDGRMSIYSRLVTGFGLTVIAVVVGAYIGLKSPWPWSAVGLVGAIAGTGVMMGWLFRARTLRD